jgi:hypothetical protein
MARSGAGQLAFLYICIAFGIAIVSLLNIGGTDFSKLSLWGRLGGTVGVTVLSVAIGAIFAGIAIAVAGSFFVPKATAFIPILAYMAVLQTIFVIVDIWLFSLPVPSFFIFATFFAVLGEFALFKEVTYLSGQYK